MTSSAYRANSVLVVDDQEFVLKIVSTMLERIGFGQITTSKDGTEALKIVKQAMPDLIICDINMKPMDGIGFLRELRGGGVPKGLDVPLIFLTAETSQDMVATATGLGCNMFLLKPVSPQKLFEKIQQILGGDAEPD